MKKYTPTFNVFLPLRAGQLFSEGHVSLSALLLREIDERQALLFASLLRDVNAVS